MKTLQLSLFLIIISPALFGQSITIGEDGIVRCKDITIGTTEEISGDTYEVVDKELLIQRRDEGADLSKSCVSNVTNMDSLFYSQKTFNQDISSWDVSNVITMRSIFHSAEAFNQPLQTWDVSNVNDMTAAFYIARAFNQNIGNGK